MDGSNNLFHASQRQSEQRPSHQDHAHHALASPCTPQWSSAFFHGPHSMQESRALSPSGSISHRSSGSCTIQSCTIHILRQNTPRSMSYQDVAMSCAYLSLCMARKMDPNLIRSPVRKYPIGRSLRRAFGAPWAIRQWYKNRRKQVWLLITISSTRQLDPSLHESVVRSKPRSEVPLHPYERAA